MGPAGASWQAYWPHGPHHRTASTAPPHQHSTAPMPLISHTHHIVPSSLDLALSLSLSLQGGGSHGGVVTRRQTS